MYRRFMRAARLVAVTTTTMLLPAVPAFAAPDTSGLTKVIDNLIVWIGGILAAMATLFLTIGGIRYLTAGGDPAEVEKAKSALKSALIGYALAVLAPVLLTALQSILG
jgi:Type IV secretion system pilin